MLSSAVGVQLQAVMIGRVNRLIDIHFLVMIRDVPRFSRVVVTQGLRSRGYGVASKTKHCNSCTYVF